MNKYERAAVVAKRKVLTAELAQNTARIALQRHCTHPEQYRRETKEDSDDGYGHWYRRTGEQCTLCGKTRTYAGRDPWLATSYWLRP